MKSVEDEYFVVLQATKQTLNAFVVVKKTQSPKAYLSVFLMPFDCVGVEMHIEGHILEIRCRVCQNKDGRCLLEAGRSGKQVNRLKKSL